MRTITVSPGEEIRIVCGESNNKSNNKGNKKNNNNTNKRANLNTNNSNAEDMNYLENDANNNANTTTEDEELEDIDDVNVGGKRGRKTRKASKKGRKGTQKGGKKRAPNGYMKFAAEMRPKILKEYPELKSDVVSVARKIGEAWRKMPEAEKKKY